MQPALKWLFTVRDAKDNWERSFKIAAQLIVLASPLLAAALLWRVSNGLAACVLMMGVCVVGFLFTTWYRWNFTEPPPPDPSRRIRRQARTAFWRNRILWLAEHDQGKQGDLARSIKKGWDEAEASKAAANDEPRS